MSANWLKLSDRWVNLDRLVIVKPGQVTLDAPGHPCVPGLHLDTGQDIEHVTNATDIGKVLSALDARCQLPCAPASLVPAPAINTGALMAGLVGLLDGLDANGDPERSGINQQQWEERVRFARQALTNAELVVDTSAGRYPPSVTPQSPHADVVAALRELMAAIDEYGSLDMIGLTGERASKAEDAARAVLARIDDVGVRAEVEGDGPEGDS